MDLDCIRRQMTKEDFDWLHQMEQIIHDEWMGPEWQTDDFQIGKALCTIYNNALFRGEKGSGSWVAWCSGPLQRIAPGSGRSKNWADYRRFFYEVKILIEKSSSKAVAKYPVESISQAKELRGFIPRRWTTSRGYGHGQWMPSDLANGDYTSLVQVWERACENAEMMELTNGPRVSEVIAAREELKFVVNSRARFFEKKPTGRRPVAA